MARANIFETFNALRKWVIKTWREPEKYLPAASSSSALCRTIFIAKFSNLFIALIFSQKQQMVF